MCWLTAERSLVRPWPAPLPPLLDWDAPAEAGGGTLTDRRTVGRAIDAAASLAVHCWSAIATLLPA
jgi:hypothetical protein